MEVLEVIDIGTRWRILANREATVRRYLDRPPGRTEDCRCRFCKNYPLALPQAPAPFTDLVFRLGVDLTKDSTVGLVRVEDGAPVYSGSFGVVGELVAGEDCYEPVPNPPGSFRVHFRKAFEGVELALHPWRRASQPSLAIHYHVRLPWLLEEDIRNVSDWLHGFHREPMETIFDADG